MYSWFCQGAKATTTTTEPIAFEFHSKERALLAALHFLVHFFDVHGATILLWETSNVMFCEDVSKRLVGQIYLSFFELGYSH